MSDSKFNSAFSESFDYHVSKIRDYAGSNSDVVAGGIGDSEAVRESLDHFEQALKARPDVGSFGHLNDDIDRVRYALDKLDADFDPKRESGLDPQAAMIYAEYVFHETNELKRAARDFDSE